MKTTTRTYEKRAIGPSKYVVCKKYTAEIVHPWLIPVYEHARLIAGTIPGAIVTSGSRYREVTGLRRPPLQLFLDKVKVIKTQSKEPNKIRHCRELFTQDQAKDEFTTDAYKQIAHLAGWQ